MVPLTANNGLVRSRTAVRVPPLMKDGATTENTTVRNNQIQQYRDAPRQSAAQNTSARSVCRGYHRSHSHTLFDLSHRKNHQDENYPHREVLPRLQPSKPGNTVQRDGQDQGSQESADYISATAAETTSSQQDGGDSAEFQSLSRVRVPGENSRQAATRRQLRTEVRPRQRRGV